MNPFADFGSMGRFYLDNDSYGAAAFSFHRAITQDNTNADAWNGLIMSFTLMRREEDAQTALARYALQEALPFDKNLVTFAMMMFQRSPLALFEWFRAMSKRFGLTSQERETYAQMSDEMEQNYRLLEEKQGEALLKAQGVFSLEEFAGRVMELDVLTSETIDSLFTRAQQWLGEDADSALNAVRLLCMVPDARSEKMLRRVCRNEDMNGKVITQALLSLRWLGVRGNIKIHKMGEPYVVNLDDPQPELTISVPAAYKPALDRMKLWIAKEQGVVSAEEYEAHASTDEPELPQELADKLAAAEVPSAWQEVIHTLIRASYDQYYPFVPTIRNTREWSNAFILLIKQYIEGIGEPWPYGEPERDDTAVLHRNWMLSAYPDFKASIEAAAKLRALLPK
ncbi:HEAT repeat domain-containing protein [Paenibacillus ginsengarvi]|uniref:HEAT repeat domain-containing protein n=1 Tax=Paenibacillus ginsengarvi TaxID=400777 RepID=A0A3B0C324_9BACL|nr:HEAT repeat domain-containing protein [Paenibacillus ginsengarvi]RKN79041.1 HEAT repeat domain-containing protein [Paenibacillus ginsengarvi]